MTDLVYRLIDPRIKAGTMTILETSPRLAIAAPSIGRRRPARAARPRGAGQFCADPCGVDRTALLSLIVLVRVDRAGSILYQVDPFDIVRRRSTARAPKTPGLAATISVATFSPV